TPIVLLSARTPGGWRRVGTVVTLADVMSAEGGQEPWWEVFKWEEARADNFKGKSSLELSGSVGVRWRATAVLTMFADSSVVEVELQLSSPRSMKLYGLRLSPLLAGEGSFGAAASETLSPRPVWSASVSAVRWCEVTVGAL